MRNLFAPKRQSVNVKKTFNPKGEKSNKYFEKNVKMGFLLRKTGKFTLTRNPRLPAPDLCMVLGLKHFAENSQIHFGICSLSAKHFKPQAFAHLGHTQSRNSGLAFHARLDRQRSNLGMRLAKKPARKLGNPISLIFPRTLTCI